MVRKKVALIFIGTGKYLDFLEDWKKSIDSYFMNDCEKNIFVFSDLEPKEPGVIHTEVPKWIWPEASLYRFKMMLKVKEQLEKHDYIFYIDSDLFAQQEIHSSEIIEKDTTLVGVHHPGNFVNPDWYTWEDSKDSLAYVPGKLSDYGEKAVYFQGCFWGGKSENVLELCENLDAAIDEDLSKGIMAKWIDESHLNKYFLDRLDEVKIMPFNYAFPEQEQFRHLVTFHPMKFMHVEKSHEEYFYGLESNSTSKKG